MVLDIDITQPSVGWPMIALRGNGVVPSKERSLLDDINICKHFRFSDAFVLGLYSPDYQKLRWQRGVAPYYRCSTCVWPLSQPNLARFLCGELSTGGEYESCDIDVHFFIEANRNDEETLQIFVGRENIKFSGMYVKGLSRSGTRLLTRTGR